MPFPPTPLALLQAVVQPPVIDPAALGGSQASIFDIAQRLQVAGPSFGAYGPTLIAAGLSLGVGVVGGVALARVLETRGKDRNKAKWPRDWPKRKDLFTNDPNPTKPGYLPWEAATALGTGAMPLGRTYPRYSIFPDRYPFRELRRMVEYATSTPVWVPEKKRLQHTLVYGATGKGKSTSLVIPVLAFGAEERNTSYFALDVKTPQFVRMFAALYRKTGKDVIFLDPWSPDETLAFEPLWRATDERKDIIADVIATYSADGGDQQSSENSAFFRESAIRLIRGLLELAQYWPRRHCNLPALQQIVGVGGNAIKEALQKSITFMPTLDETIAAIEVVLPLAAEDLRRRPRNEIVEGALAVLDRSGYRMAFLLKRMRHFEAEAARGGGGAAEGIEATRKAFWANVKHEWLERRARLEQLLMNQGDFINGADDTRNSIVSTLSNKVGWFRDANIARVFSRDELDVSTLVERPSLFIVGAPMAKLQVGSLFVSSLLTRLALNAVFQRGMALERGEAGTAKHDVHFMLDEFAQLNVREAPKILATFRGFKSSLTMVLQERAQLKKMYGEDAVTMEANAVHKLLFNGAHEDTAEFYAKALGEVAIRKRSESGVSGEKKSVSESIENVPLVTMTDMKEGRLNGIQRPQLAFSVGADTSPFPVRVIPFYEDPTLRRMLNMRRTLNRKGYSGERTWKFWQWQEMWEPASEGREYLKRRRQRTPAERAAGVPDPVYERAQDPYTLFLDYLVPERPRVYDELIEPRLDLAAIGVTDNDPRAKATKAAQVGGGGAMPGVAAGVPPKPAALQAALLVPVYGVDFREMINDDFAPLADIAAFGPIGGSLAERVARVAELPSAEELAPAGGDAVDAEDMYDDEGADA